MGFKETTNNIVFICACLCLAIPAIAADLLPEIPPPSPLQDTLDTPETIDHLRIWTLNFDLDVDTEYLVQITRTFGRGGNGYFYEHFLLDDAQTHYKHVHSFKLQDGIKSVAQNGNFLSLILYRYLEGDGRCCPSGEYKTQLAF